MSRTKKKLAGSPKGRVAVPVAPARAKRWPWAVAFLGAAAVVFLAYGPAMHGPFMLDDSTLPYRLPGVATAPLKAWLAGMRPVLMLSFWLNYKAQGEETFGYHVVNVLLHLLNGILVFLISRKILYWAGAVKERLNVLAGFAAGLFLLHPVQTESVAYVASRSETLSVFFFYAAFTAFLYRKQAVVSFKTAALVLVLFGAACLTKEHTVVLPALLLLTDYFWNPGFSITGIRRNARLYVPLAVGALLGLAFVGRILSQASTAGFGMSDLRWYQYFFTECRAIWVYLRLFLLPIGQNLDYDFATSRTVLDRGAILGQIGLVALVVAAWIYRRKFPLASYGLLVFLVLLAPTSSIVPIRDTLVERRMYLPFIGLLFIALEVARRWMVRERGWAMATMGTLLLVLGVLCYQRNLLWGDAAAIWKDSAEKSPAKVRPGFQLAFAYYQQNRCDDATREFERTSRLAPPNYDLLVDWALSYDCANQPAKAIATLEKAVALERNAHAYALMGMVYGKNGRTDQALAALDTAEKLNPQFEMTYVYRGNVFAQQRNWIRAVAEYRHALEINPDNQAARAGLDAAGTQGN